MYLSVPFMRANGMTKPGLITLVGKDGVKWKVNLKEEGSGSALCLGTGWKEFAKANGLKTGDYFTLESAWKNEIPMLSLVNTESASDRKERGESSKAMEKERSTDTSSIVQNRVVTLALETKDVKACTLNLPSEFVTAIGIKKLGKITFLGKDGMKWWGCLLSRDGTVAVGIGWRNFCEANGVKLGESFSLVLINEEEDTDVCPEVVADVVAEADVVVSGEDHVESRAGHLSYWCDPEGRNIPKKKNLEREAESSSLDPSCFLATIWPSSLRYDTLNLPRSFVRSNGLETRCGGEIVLMNEKGKSWTLALKQKLSGSTYIRRGWRRFCSANVLKTGGVYTFKLIHSGRTPGLPMKFSRENGLDTRCGEIVLMNDKGRTWKLNLKRKRSCGTMYITQGWRSFCSANGLRAGSFFTFKLIKKGGAQVLRLSPKEREDCSSEANEMESLSTETESDEESIQYEKQIKKHRSTWKASSSQSQNRFLTLALKPFNLEKYILYLPVRFSRSHGINEEAKMTLLDKNGVKWSTDLRSEETSDRIRLVGGWQEFFKANCMKPGESIIVKLIWEGDKSCVLKFCSKVKHETK
ncbi:hypothetical protein F2Q70_00027840 [Brassica cretica]|uniref:TF-B3 domain-containing protein n=2 Tax=Brassica TaxID=3705 RepID=A0A8S9LCN0_BRACR|nr:hypothetical protein F2Q70_00027840 [Brassica cretica]